MMKKQNGITLIALVITIIVLLILAGVSIAMLTGDNGILTKATTAGDDTREAEIKEAVSLAVSTLMAEKNDPTSTVADGEKTLSYANVAKQIKKDNVGSNATGATEGITYEYGKKSYPVTYTMVDKYGNAATDETKAVGVKDVTIGEPTTVQSGS